MQRVPIQRLRSGRGRRESRTARACDLCRRRKMKCDGNKPCATCAAHGVTICTYSDGKIARNRQQFESLKQKVEIYERLLRNIAGGTNMSMTEHTSDVPKNPFACSDESTERSSTLSSFSSDDSQLDEIDVVSEDLNWLDETRAAGYMGKLSEVKWMQQLGWEIEQRTSTGSSSAGSGRRPSESLVASTNYHLDTHIVPDTETENPFALPSQELADQLLSIYFNKIQSSVPVIRRDLFTQQYRRVFSDKSVRPGEKWLGIFNAVLAISSRYCRLVGNRVDCKSEEIFFSRANALHHSENIIYRHDDLQQVQAMTLLAFYFLCRSQINRSWKLIGMAARAALALGLHIQRANCDLNVEGLEARKRLWWSIHYIEHVLCTLTGRPSHLPGGFSQRAPLLFTRLDANGSGQTRDLEWTLYQHQNNIEAQRAFLMLLPLSGALFFFYQVDLGLITQAIGTRGYGCGAAYRSWPEMTSYITFYSQKLDQWKSSLHPSLVFDDIDGNPLPHDRVSPYTHALAFAYYSSQIVLNKSFLDQSGSAENQGVESAAGRFHKNAAGTCLNAATALIGVLPEKPDLVWAYNLPLWWNLLHFLTQATVILLTHVSAISVPERISDRKSTRQRDLGPTAADSPTVVLNALRKGFGWLESLSATSRSAFEAFKMCDRCIRRIAAITDLDLSGFPTISQPSRCVGTDASQSWSQRQSPTITSYTTAATSDDSDWREPVPCMGAGDFVYPQESCSVPWPEYSLSPTGSSFSVQDVDAAMADVHNPSWLSSLEDTLQLMTNNSI